MRRALVDSIPNSAGQTVWIPEGEAKHLTQVLRLRNGDTIEVLDGRGKWAQGKLGFKDRGGKQGAELFAELTSDAQSDPSRLSHPITLYQCVIKGDAMEWLVEKAVELGVRKLVPIESEFSVVDFRKKGAEVFQDRWQKIADQALKQCGRLDRLKIEAPMNLEQALAMHPEASPNQSFWADEKQGEATSHLQSELSSLLKSQGNFPKDLGVWIGPEGGWSPNERLRLLQLTNRAERGISRVNLGSTILRAETAALFGVSLLLGYWVIQGNTDGKRTNSV